MQTIPDAAAESTPFSTPLPSADEQLLSPEASNSPTDIDPLIAHTAKRLADVINDFKRELDKRDSVWADTRGTFEITLKDTTTRTYELAIVHDEDGEEYPITVQATQKKEKSAVNGAPKAAASSTTSYTPVRRSSDVELERDIVSRRKRKFDEEGPESGARKRPRPDEDEDDDIMPLISKDDLEDLLSKLREDIQEDTSECVNHVQRLLRRFKEEWHEKSKWEYEKLSSLRESGAHGAMPARNNSVDAGSFPSAFPSPALDRDENTTGLQDFVRREAKLLSSQIRWVEECRRVAADAHDKREETWRTSSAGFHDRNRQDREAFQNRMLQESTMHGRVLTQILNEVKGLAHVTMSLKWETPDPLANHPAYPPAPSIPAFPTQPAPPARPPGRGSGTGPKR